MSVAEPYHFHIASALGKNLNRATALAIVDTANLSKKQAKIVQANSSLTNVGSIRSSVSVQ
jgi:hypothetical protein